MYNWDGKEDECYRLYVRERKSLKEVATYWEQRGFTPSKRAFQTQFKRWGFPGKHNPAHKNPVLIARVKELWERNATQKDMLDVLQGERFQISEWELVRLRSRFKWFMRDSRGRKESSGVGDESAPQKKRGKGVRTAGSDLIDQLAASILQESSESEEEESADELDEGEERESETSPTQSGPIPPPTSLSLSPAEALRRQLRQQQLQVESDEKWRARKRRRRTRGWAGLHADAPGEPPRFPSETTLDESKAYLGLDNSLYAQIRGEFQAICRSEDVFKKTVAGPEKWAELVQRLVCENPHLTNVFQEQAESLNQVDVLWKPKHYKTLSLDIICQDVTKRMRAMETRMSIPEAKNTLKLNPSQTREVRHAFYQILKKDGFTRKFEAGGQRWNELKQRWVDGSEPLRIAISSRNGGDAEHAQRLRAVELLARDVMKRLRAETTRMEKEQAGEPSGAVHRGPGPGPAPPSAPVQDRISRSTPPENTRRQPANTNSQLSGPYMSHTAVPQLPLDADLQIDPSLLLAASDAILPRSPSLQYPAQTHRSHTPSIHSYTSSAHPFQPTSLFPLPIYFRLHPHSLTHLPLDTVWLSVLQTPTLDDVRRLVAREHPGSEAVALEGVVGAGSGEVEVCVGIDDDAELGAYLRHVATGSWGRAGKAVMVVRLGMRV